jgi:hypothetical protein
MSDKAFLEIVAINQPDDKTPKVFHAEILRETNKTFITKESFTFGITGHTIAQMNKKQVNWLKENGRRQGEDTASYEPSFHAKRAVMENELPKDAVRI